jgi:hypothetical protein
MRVDMLAAFAYVLGPVSGLCSYSQLLPFLNWFAQRFFFLSSRHRTTTFDSTVSTPALPLWPCAALMVLEAYQSALLTSPLLLIRILASLAGFTPWLRSFFTLCIICIEAYMA